MENDLTNGTFLFKIDLYHYTPKNQTTKLSREKRLVPVLFYSALNLAGRCATNPTCVGIVNGAVWGAFAAYNAPPGYRLEYFKQGFSAGRAAGPLPGRRKRSAETIDGCNLLRMMVNSMDKNQDGKLEFDEIHTETRTAYDALFTMDKNGNNYLEFEEINECLSSNSTIRRMKRQECQEYGACPQNLQNFNVQVTPVYYVPTTNGIYV